MGFVCIYDKFIAGHVGRDLVILRSKLGRQLSWVLACIGIGGNVASSTKFTKPPQLSQCMFGSLNVS